jgi:fructokinase
MFDIIAIGELLIDFTPNGYNEKGVPLYAENPGGAPANVAVSASKLGCTTAFIGKVGRDSFGDFLKDILNRSQVNTDGIAMDPIVHTTLAFVNLGKNGERSFCFYCKPGADIMLEKQDIRWEMVQQTHFLCFGSVALSDEPSRSTVLHTVQKAREMGVIICYDPNFREPLWDSKEDALEWMKAGLVLTDILKVSIEEMELLTGICDCESGSKMLSDLGSTLVMVTLGERGAFYRLGDLTGYVNGFSVNAIDTTGAGDTFLGSVLFKLRGMDLDMIRRMSKEELEAMLTFANKAASITTTRYGAIPAMPALDEILT